MKKIMYKFVLNCLSLILISILLFSCKAKEYEVKVIESPGITIVGENPLKVKDKGTASFNIEIKEGYEFVSVSIGSYDVSSKSLTVLNVRDNINIEFTLLRTYLVTVTSGTGGGRYKVGDTVVLIPNQAVPTQEFLGWEVSGVVGTTNSDHTYTFTMPEGHVVATATYQTIRHNVVVTGGTGGGSKVYGTSVTVSPNVAPSGKLFKEYVVVGATGTLNANNTYTFVMPNNDVSITVVFEDAYLLTVEKGTGSGLHLAGEQITVTPIYPIPALAYTFIEWVVEGVSGTLNSDNSYTFTMPANDVSIEGIFEQINDGFVVELTHDENSHFTATSYSVVVVEGESAVFENVVLSQGFVFSTLSSGAIYDSVLHTITINNVSENQVINFTQIASNQTGIGSVDLSKPQALTTLFLQSGNIVNHNSEMTGIDNRQSGWFVYQISEQASAVVFQIRAKDWWVSRDKTLKVYLSKDNYAYEEIEFDITKGSYANEYYTLNYIIELDGNTFVKFELPAIDDRIWETYIFYSLLVRGFYNISVSDTASDFYTVTTTDALVNVAYGKTIELHYEFESGYRFKSVNIGTFNKDTSILTFNTKDLTSTNVAITLVAEEIPAILSLTLEHNDNSHFTADSYYEEVLLNASYTFTNVVIEEGYSLLSLSSDVVYSKTDKTITVNNVENSRVISLVVIPDNEIGVESIVQNEAALSRIFAQSGNIGNRDQIMNGVTNKEAGFAVYQFSHEVSSVVLTIRVKDWWVNSNKVLVISYSSDNYNYTQVPFNITSGQKVESEYYVINFLIELNGNSFVKLEFPEIDDSIWETYTLRNIQAKGYYNITVDNGDYYEVGTNEYSNIAYGQVIEIPYTFELGYRFSSVNYGTFNQTTSVLSVDTTKLTQTSITVTLIAEPIPDQVEITLVHDESSHFSANVYSYIVELDGSYTFTNVVIENGYSFNAITPSNAVYDSVAKTISIENVVVNQDINFDVKADNKVGVSQFITNSASLEKIFTYTTGINSDAENRLGQYQAIPGYIIYQFDASVVSVLLELNGKSWWVEQGKVLTISKSVDNNVYTNVAFNLLEGTNTHDDYYTTNLLVELDGARFIKITFPNISTVESIWDKYYLTSVSANGDFNVSVPDGSHYSLLESDPSDLTVVSYGTTITLSFEIEDGYRFVSVNYGVYNTETNVLVIDSTSFTTTNPTILLVLELIPETVEVELIGNNFTADSYIESDELGATIVFTNVEIEEGYYFISLTSPAVYDSVAKTITLNNVIVSQAITLTVQASNPVDVENIIQNSSSLSRIFTSSGNLFNHDNEMTGLPRNQAGYAVYQFSSDVSSVIFTIQVKDWWVSAGKVLNISLSKDNNNYSNVPFNVKLGIHEGEYYNIQFLVDLSENSFVRFDFQQIDDDIWNSYSLRNIQAKGYYGLELSEGEHFSVVGDYDLSHLPYNEVVNIEYEIEAGYRYLSVNYGTYNTGTNVLTINTKNLPSTSVTVTLVVEEIPALVTISLAGTHFASDSREEEVVVDSEVVFTNVEIEEGYSFLSLTSPAIYDSVAKTITIQATSTQTITLTVQSDNKINVGSVDFTKPAALSSIFAQSGNIENHNNEMTGIKNKNAGYLVLQFDDSVVRAVITIIAKDTMVGNPLSVSYSRDNNSYSPLSFILTSGTYAGENYTVNFEIDLSINHFVKIAIPATSEEIWDSYHITLLKTYGNYSINAGSGEHHSYLSSTPSSLDAVAYNTLVEIVYTLEDGFFVSSSNYGSFNNVNSTLTLNTTVFGNTLNPTIILNVEEIPTSLTVNLTGDNFTSNTYTESVEFGNPVVFTNVVLAPGYSFKSITPSNAIYDSNLNTITIESVEGDVNIVLTVKEDNILEVSGYQLGTALSLTQIYDSSGNLRTHEDEFLSTNQNESGFITFQVDEEAENVIIKIRVKKIFYNEHYYLVVLISDDNYTFTNIPVVMSDGETLETHFWLYNLSIPLTTEQFIRIEFPAINEAIWDAYSIQYLTVS